MTINKEAFAREWIDSWNSHDLERILAHYSDDFEITSPMIAVVTRADTGTLKGKEQVRKYWEAALEKFPDLHFELHEVAESVGSVALYYTSVLDKEAIEVMFFNQEGKVCKVIAHYA